MLPTRVPFKPIQRFCKSYMGFRFKLPSYCYIKYKNIPSRLKIRRGCPASGRSDPFKNPLLRHARLQYILWFHVLGTRNWDLRWIMSAFARYKEF